MPELPARKPLLVGVNEVSDPRNLTGLEKKHLPVIEAPDRVHPDEPFDVGIEVGAMEAHPNERGHHIEFLEIYADETFLARVDLTGMQTCPKATVRLSLSGPVKELRAYERCNVHGVWVYRKPILVEK